MCAVLTIDDSHSQADMDVQRTNLLLAALENMAAGHLAFIAAEVCDVVAAWYGAELAVAHLFECLVRRWVHG